jgi:hypothetical protein
MQKAGAEALRLALDLQLPQSVEAIEVKQVWQVTEQREQLLGLIFGKKPAWQMQEFGAAPLN